MHAPCASRTASRGGNLRDDDERRGKTLRSEREWYQGDSREKRERAGRKEKEWDRIRGNGQRNKRGWNGAIAREKEDMSERDGGPAKMRSWERENSCESEREGD